jgi:hypothetical protein
VLGIRYHAAGVTIDRIKFVHATANGFDEITERYGLAARNKIEENCRKIEKYSLHNSR